MKPKLRDELIGLLYPDDIKCIVCGREIHPNRYGLCGDCSFELNENYCARCGRHKVGVGDYCGECGDVSLAFDEARSSVSYVGNALDTVHRLKYGDARYLARHMCEYMLDTLLFADWSFDCFTFVPADPKRIKKRGYNQARLLAERLADKTTAPCCDLLEKTRQTPNQARLGKTDRLNNIVGAFAARTAPPEHVVLVDDVLTTGATANECARTLKKAGAKIVFVLTFASVPERSPTDKPAINIRDFRPQ